jgi:hypothetical protein
VACLGHENAAVHANHSTGFLKHQLDEPRVAPRLLGEPRGERRRLDAGERDDASLGFGDDLLGEHENVAVRGLDLFSIAGVEREGREVVARADLGKAP